MYKKIVVIVGLFLLLTLGAAGVWFGARALFIAARDIKVAMPFTLPEAISVQRDIRYCQELPEQQLLDLYYPQEKSVAGYPLVVYIHGGGWIGGDKTSPVAEHYIAQLSRWGYVVAAVNYRLTPEPLFPGQVRDVNCAIGYLVESASKYNIDSRHIALIGESAGGHLAALAGVASDHGPFRPEQYPDPSRISAVVTLAAPIDIEGLLADKTLATRLLGPARARDASPVTYITPDDPPFLIVHGRQDRLVPPVHASLLHDSLQSVQVDSRLILLEQVGHELRPRDPATEESVMGAMTEISQFLHARLRTQ